MEEDSSSWPVREKRARLTIFNRLTLSYLLILSLVTAMVLYAVFQFQRLNRIAGELQNVHRRIIDSGEKLADTLLSEVRYEKKFVITRAPVHLNQFGQFARDFERDFDALLPIAKYPELQDTLRRIRASHNRYQYGTAHRGRATKHEPDAERDRICGGQGAVAVFGLDGLVSRAGYRNLASDHEIHHSPDCFAQREK
jgi:hypothetical protein